MSRLRRIVRQVATGMVAGAGLAALRRLLAWRREQHGDPARLTRRERRRRRARARVAARWALANAESLRQFLDTSESASAQLSGWDNARRTADSFLGAADVVRERLAAERPGPSRDALQTKLADLEADAGPQLHAAATVQAELTRLQGRLREQEKRLRADAPAEIASAAKTLVAAHGRARQPMRGAFDELGARRRLDELTELREAVEAMLGDATRAAT